MNDEVRKAGDYTIIYSLHIGDREVVLGEDMENQDGQKYMCAFCTSNGLFAQYDDALASDDYPEMVAIYGKRIAEQAEKTRIDLSTPKYQGIPNAPLTAKDCTLISHDDDLHDKVIVIKPEVLRREYRMATRQIKLCTGGFGASPHSRGSACYCVDLYSGKESRFERMDVLGTLEPEQLPEWARLGLVEYRQKQKKSKEAVLAVARKHMCQLAVLKFQQLDGLNTVLPIGTRKINAFRTLTTESLAVFMPFKVQEIQDKGGIYFGENAISHNLIMCNKQNLLNQSAFLLGVPGSGKSFSAKELITFLILNTEDDILICDPEGEFAPLVQAMGPETGSVIRVAAGGKDRLNAMYMVDGYGENNPIVEKSQFIMSLIEQIDKNGVGPQHKSIIDRCTAAVYQEALYNGIPPTLCTLREKLLQQPEEKAKEIALSLELFTTGSLDVFGHASTVDLDKRVLVFDIHDLGTQLKPTGLLVITDTILNRVTLNWKKGKRTHVFIDEFHVVFENEYSGAFFNSAWRQFRKRNAYPTAITQNVEYLLDSVQASTMLSNSEFIVMLNQAASDREKLARLLNISGEQMSYITNADAGCGLIKYGSALVPFVNRFPKDTKLYQLMTTKPGEGVFGGESHE